MLTTKWMSRPASQDTVPPVRRNAAEQCAKPGTGGRVVNQPGLIVKLLASIAN